MAGIFASFLTLITVVQMGWAFPPPSSPGPPVRIMPLGDSITHGYFTPGSYRAPLYQLLTNAGYVVDFVGTKTDNATPDLPDPDHEGHGGVRLDQLLVGVGDWLDEVDDPDVILVLIGANDFGQSYDLPHATNRLGNLIAFLAEQRPFAKILVANLILRTDNAEIDQAVREMFNPLVPGIVATQASLGRQVDFVDLRGAIEETDLSDQIHPTAFGYQKLATNWFQSITNQIRPLGTTNRPAVARIRGGPGLTNVTITFSKPVDDSATNVASYAVDGGLTVLEAVLDPESKRVVSVVTTPQAPDQVYRLTVEGVRDRTPEGNSIVPGINHSWRVESSDGVLSRVPEAAGYSLVYSLNISSTAWSANEPVPYDVDRHASVGPFQRVAYALELEPRNGPVRFVWASMDAFTSDPAKIGVPTIASGAAFQQTVTNLNLQSNVRRLTTGVGLTGANIEFWPGAVATTNAAAVPAASDDYFDSGDQPVAGAYGSMQIHHHDARQTVFAFNGWNSGGRPDLGIGNHLFERHPDWTGAQNAALFVSRRLQVFVLPSPLPENTNGPSLLAASGSTHRTNVLLIFDQPLSDSATNVGFYQISELAVTAATLQPNQREVLLDTALQSPGVAYTVVVDGVTARSANTNAIARGATAGFIALPEFPLPTLVAEASDYELVYQLSIPGTNAGWNRDGVSVEYSVDHRAFITRPFDRIAYYLELAAASDAPTNWIYVSMDAFTTNVLHVGVPAFATGAFFQQPLTNLNVFANVEGVVTGTGLVGGNIEFWPHDNAPGNSAGVTNASDSLADWGDQPDAAVQGRGSMQIHNSEAGQTLFAYNGWGVGDTNSDLGIGNSPGPHFDWTFAHNAGDYIVKNLYVLARFAGPSAPPPCGPVILTQPESQTNVAGMLTRLFVRASGADLGYQWRHDGLPIPGATNAEFTVVETRAGDVGSYAVEVTNRCGAVTSLVAFINIDHPPSLLAAAGSTHRTNVLLIFDQPLSDSATNVGFYQISELAVTAATLQPNQREVLLDTALQSPGVAYTVVVDGVTARSANTNAIARGATAGFIALPEFPLPTLVAEASDYELVYQLSIAGTNAGWNRDGVSVEYSVDHRAFITRPFDRIAYYLELAAATDAPTNWIYVSMDAFTTNVLHVGVPAFATGAFFQQPLTNLNVFANVEGVVTGTGLVGGNIEFWPHDNAPGNSAGVTNASDSLADWGDQPDAAVQGRGSMQIHNSEAGQTLFAYNGWGVGDTNSDLGIGNSPEPHFDWTFAHNAGDYIVKNLYVLVRFGSGASVPPPCGPVILTQPESQTNVAGMLTRLFVRASGADLGYQWRHDGLPIPGATNAEFTVVETRAGDVGSYAVEVTNRCGAVTSLVAFINIDHPPSLLAAAGSTHRTNVLLIFDQPLSDSATNVGFYQISELAVTAATLQPNQREVLLDTALQSPGVAYTVIVDGVTARSANTNAIARGATAGFIALPEFPLPTLVAEASDYELVYQLSIPGTNAGWNRDGVSVEYSVDHRAFITRPFDRIAYYLELAAATDAPTDWIYVSMDAFTTNVLHVGVPAFATGAFFQQPLTNLNVFANVEGVVTGTGLVGGNIEFWPHDNAPGNSAGVTNASDSLADWGDQPDAAVQGRGSMQIHNSEAGQTLFAYNGWGVGDTNSDLGIGNSPGPHFDWTFAHNAGDYIVKNLYVLARFGSGPSVPPPCLPVILTQPETQTNVVGMPARLFVRASGADLWYQWRHNGRPIEGATNAEITVIEFRACDAGSYEVEVTSRCGTVTSLAAIIEIARPAPPIQASLIQRGSELLLRWTGGAGPFQVQQSDEPDPNGHWQTIANLGCTNHLNITNAEQLRFFRVVEPSVHF